MHSRRRKTYRGGNNEEEKAVAQILMSMKNDQMLPPKSILKSTNSAPGPNRRITLKTNTMSKLDYIKERFDGFRTGVTQNLANYIQNETNSEIKKQKIDHFKALKVQYQNQFYSEFNVKRGNLTSLEDIFQAIDSVYRSLKGALEEDRYIPFNTRTMKYAMRQEQRLTIEQAYQLYVYADIILYLSERMV